MNIVKKVLFIFSISFSIVISAQKTEAKAKSILEAVSGYYKTKKAIYFKFIYSTGKGKSLKNQTGVFYASKDKYKFKVMGNEQIFDGKKIYNINAEEQEITIAKPSSNDVFLSPIGYLDSYKKGYIASYVGKKNYWDIIKLTPMQDTSIKQVLLYINSNKKQIEKVEQYGKNSFISITISQYKENLNIQDSMFSFDKNLYKNYLITEL